MAARFGSITRSVMSTARSSSFIRSPPPSAAPRFRIPPSSRRHPSFSPSRNFGELGCVQSLLPFGNAATMPCLTGHLSLDVRAFSELCNGT
ncbi:protein NUCLEAR FUSION DEFECTIVE 6, mitochondrial-like isoform X2 [Silene latifolia]|uniref:protein NUCLEAR FUSION DEFECTIVE 6, mitochondrial-like isoform X2 n=1 Tax=Silene latifolia TaxID=37657 RepID=UPI003D76EEFC